MKEIVDGHVKEGTEVSREEMKSNKDLQCLDCYNFLEEARLAINKKIRKKIDKEGRGVINE